MDRKGEIILDGERFSIEFKRIEQKEAGNTVFIDENGKIVAIMPKEGLFIETKT